MLLHGNCLDKLKELKDNSIDSIVTDPPYGLSFMGKSWDYDVPSEEIWKECFRVLKPGGHLLAFFGTRTYHRGVIKIEDAGFEIRDQIQWIYGSGFPKSTDVSKRIDKEAGAEREVIGENPNKRNAHKKGAKGFDKDLGGEKLESMGVTCPATDSAKQWQGWGSALKPANEPIVAARKPLEKGLTLAENVLKYGTGAINIDESRIEGTKPLRETTNGNEGLFGMGSRLAVGDSTQGRWPANIIFDEAAAELLDAQSGISTRKDLRTECKAEGFGAGLYEGGKIKNAARVQDQGGGASRFFYVAKASKSERNANCDLNNHPTVKPIKLMQYLVKLVTPPKGTVLDPFMGSGSTGVAAVKLGFKFVGCEMSDEYIEIAKKRIKAAKVNSPKAPEVGA